MTLPTPNDGTRPSRLQLDRYATGELTEAERAELESSLDEPARAHLAAVEAERERVRPLDIAALRARTAALPDAPSEAPDRPAVPLPSPANRPWSWLPLVSVAAALLLAALPLLSQGPPDPAGIPSDYVGIRGAARLEPYHLRDGALRPYDGAPLGEGDVLGFRVAAEADRVVVLAVDGEGRVSVFWPDGGGRAEPMPADGALPGSIVLDDAPGPEVFVAVFDRSPAEAVAAAEGAWAASGADGLLGWAERDARVDAVVVERR